MSAATSRLQFILSLVDRVSGPLGRIMSRIGSMTSRVGRMFGTAFKYSGAAVTGFVGVASNNLLDLQRELTATSAAFGINEQAMQRWTAAGSSFGLEGDKITDIMKDVNDKIGDFSITGGGEAKDLFEKLGLNVADFKGIAPDQMILKIGAALDKSGLQTSEKIFLMEGLADDASRLLPLLENNAEALTRMGNLAERSGAILSTADSAALKEANGNMGKIKLAMKGLTTQAGLLGAHFLNAFGGNIAEAIISVSRWIRATWDNTAGLRAQLMTISGSAFRAAGDVIARAADQVQGWLPVLATLQAKFAEFRGNVTAAFTRVRDHIVNNSDAITVALGMISTVALGAFTRWPALAGRAVQWLGGVWRESFAAMRGQLPALQANVKNVMGTVGAWFTANGSKIQTAFAGVATRAMQTFGRAMDWLSAKSSDGSMTRWLDEMLAKIQPLVSNVLAFGKGLLIGAAATALAVLYVKDLVGGWENFGKLVVGVAVFMFMGPFIAALSTAAILLFTLGQIAYATSAFVLMLAKALRLVQIAMAIGRAAAFIGVMLAIGASMLTASIGTWTLAGAMAFLASPIVLIVAGLAALAAGAYYLYTHWAQVKAYLGETAWGQMLLTAIGWVTSPLQTFNAAVTYLSGLWASTKASLAETAWGQAIMAAINALFSPFEMFKGAVDSAKAVWNGIKSSLADTGWGQAILGTIDSIMGAIDRFKAGWASMKAAASEQISGGWGSLKAAVGFGGESSPANGGARALGGTVLPGHFYRVNERGPELMQTMGQTYLMTGGAAGNIIPFPTSASSPDKGRSGGVSLPEARPLNVRELFGNATQKAGGNSPARSGKTIHIGAVHIHTNNKIDPYELEQQLGMLG